MKLRYLLTEIRVKSQPYFRQNYSSNNLPILTGITDFIKDLYEIYSQEKFDAFFQQNSTLQNIPISKIHIGQPYIDLEKLENLKNFNLQTYQPIHIYKFKGKLYLYNGHHRLIKVIESGEKNIRSLIFDLDKLIKNDSKLKDDLDYNIQLRT